MAQRFGLTPDTLLLRLDEAGRERGSFGIVEVVGENTWDAPSHEESAAMNRREAFWSRTTKPRYLVQRTALRTGGMFAHTNPGLGTDGDVVHWSGESKQLVKAGRLRMYNGVLVADRFISMHFICKFVPDFQRDLKARTQQLSELVGTEVLVESFGTAPFDHAVFIHLRDPLHMVMTKLVFEQAKPWTAPATYPKAG